VNVYGTPRRLAVLVKDLAPRQQSVERQVKGPPAKAAFDAEGAPTKAAEGFARSQGVDLADLQVQDLEGGKYVVAVRREEGQPAIEILAERLSGVVAEIKFDKTMRWNHSNVAFSRPIRWLVALLGDVVIPFEYAGVTSGRTTLGLRPEGSPAVKIKSAADYLDTLRDQHVIADVDERRAVIQKQIARLVASIGGEIVDLPGLLDEVTNLVEQPTALLGSFEEDYLSLPRDVLVTVMRKHQRYFPVQKDGQLMPYFVAVRNGDKRHLSTVTHGNEQVLRARFADAEFFFRHDTSKRLDDFLPRLGTLTFQEKLGSVLDKVQRIEQLTPRIAEMLGLSERELQAASRAANLCKADLATQMVVELTSLQGAMGREYALRQGEPPDVAQAIGEHYLPRYAGDQLPRSLPGIAVGLADRLDSLVGLFAVGLAPTGSADPWALRRAALGAVQVLVENVAPFSLRRSLEAAAEVQPAGVVANHDATLRDVHAFILGRLRVLLLDEGYRHDLVDAVLTEQGDVPYRVRITVQALTRWAARLDWNEILSNFARCVRITREFSETFPLDITRDLEPMTHALHDAYRECAAQVALHSSVDKFFTAFAPMVPTIAKFFVDVLVMAEDPSVRETRLALLQHIAALPKGIVDLSKVEGF
jgi:glycyl-tRNA synthetase